ncbi:MAG: carbon-nitrogen hydrolase family protein [Eubacteriales bacterium]|nr:carbon-nitrogen hydrolase family protein [Eubacteriales bacterium]
MKIALLQMGARPEKARSIAVARELIEEAAREKADLAVLPEMFNCPYQTENFPVYAEEEGGPCWQAMAEAAGASGIYLAAGSMPERDAAGRVYNTCYVFDRAGKQIGKHRKMHLFDIDVKGGQQFRESDTLSAGSTVDTFDTEFGRFGLEICYDIRFPELARLTAEAGALAIFVPGAFNMTTGPAHWELSFRARALDNQVFMVGCSQARQAGGYVSWGHSIITDPWGNVAAQMDEKEGILVHEIDLARVREIREQLPFLKQRRTDVYSLELRRPAGI